MSPSHRQTAFRIPEQQLQAMHDIKERDGIPLSEQVRRAIAMWVEEKGVVKKAARKRAVTRKQA